MKKSTKTTSRRSQLFQELLEELDLLGTFGYRPGLVMRYGMDGVRRMRAARERSYRRQELRRLQEQKLLTIETIGREYRVRLTEKGAQEAFRLQVLQAPPMPDTCVSMVVFDIPETQRSLRRELRGFLRAAGFTQLQKSVWVSDRDAWEPLARLFYVSKSAKWISVFVARRLDIDNGSFTKKVSDRTKP